MERDPLAPGFDSKRLFVRGDLSPGAEIDADRSQANYLLNVLRMQAGGTILVFNGRDGEWKARLAPAGRKTCRLQVQEQARPQATGPDLHYLFAPLKQARLDYMVQKAVEMGVSRLRPVLTQHTQASRVNLERMHANAIEAAEQCGILNVPAVEAACKLDDALAAWDPKRRLVFCDEAAPIASPNDALGAILPGAAAVLIGPEGGFSAEERERLLQRPYVTALSLGPRILRADTAAVAALALVQASIGDWR